MSDSTTPHGDETPSDPTAPIWADPTAPIPQDPTDSTPAEPAPAPQPPAAPPVAPPAPASSQEQPYGAQAPGSPYAAPQPGQPSSPYAAPQPGQPASPYASPQQPAQQQYPYAQQPPQQGQPYSYGQPAAYGQQPYWAQHGPGQPGQPGQPAYGGYYQNPYARGTGTNVSAVVLTVISALTMLGTVFVVGVPSLILGIVSLSTQTGDHEKSRRLARIGWIVYAANWAVVILLGIVIAVIAINSSGGISYNNTY